MPETILSFKDIVHSSIELADSWFQGSRQPDVADTFACAGSNQCRPKMPVEVGGGDSKWRDTHETHRMWASR